MLNADSVPDTPAIARVTAGKLVRMGVMPGAYTESINLKR